MSDQTPTTPTDPDAAAPDSPDVNRADEGAGIPLDQTRAEVNTDNEGNLIDPPIIPSFERDMAEAAAAGDVDRLAQIQENYDDARTDLAQRQAERTREAQ